MCFAPKLKVRILVALMFITSLFSALHASESSSVQHSSWQALQSGKAVMLMRHALAPGIGDPPEFDVEDCSTQRNLSEAGRLQAVAIGDVLRSNGIQDAAVSTSAWCRCRDTAQLLGYGPYEVEPALNSFFRNYAVAEQQTTQLTERISDWIDNMDTAHVLVSHQVNISALAGKPTGSGDMVIVTIKDAEVIVLDVVSAPAVR